MSKPLREFWATQLVGSEEGNYFMSVNREFVERVSYGEEVFALMRLPQDAIVITREELRDAYEAAWARRGPHNEFFPYLIEQLFGEVGE